MQYNCINVDTINFKTIMQSTNSSYGPAVILLFSGAWGMPNIATAQQVPVTEVRILATPLDSSQLQSTQPITVLRGEDLNQARRSTLGETLEATPGVQSTGFGQGAGRPIIRGLDGPRVRITENGADTFDVSAISPDHVVASNPLAAKSIEVIRGPATLIYGGSAIGGLVNVRTGLIPNSALKRSTASALVEAAARGQHSYSFSAMGGQGGLNYALGGFDKRAGDYRTPLGIQTNSFARSDGVSAGTSFVGSKGMIGLGISSTNSRYGAIAEADVVLDQKQRKIDFIAEAFEPIRGIESAMLKHSDGRYQHQEIEASTNTIGTNFKQSGKDSRVELTHTPISGIRGIFGFTQLNKKLEVSGLEAYLPNAQTKLKALYYVADKKFGDVKTEFGIRHESVGITPVVGAGFSNRSFSLNSLGLGSTLPINKTWATVLRASRNERAPVVEELYANGAHVATGTFEIGAPQLAKETSLNFDVGLHYTPSNQFKAQITGYQNRFNNYVYGQSTDLNGDGVIDRTDDTGAIVNDPLAPTLGDFTRLTYQQSKAIFHGFEIEAQWRPSNSALGLKAFTDVARGRLIGASGLNNSTPPRMSPMRFGLTLDYGQNSSGNQSSNRWSGYAQVIRVLGVSRLASQETSTPGHTLLNGELAYILGTKSQGATVFVQGRNLMNQTVRQHTSFLKDIAPMPGRTILFGVRAQF
jgi:iron complex outermembrane recepter protein